MISPAVASLADAALLLPAALLALIYLAALREGRLMLAFSASLAASAVTTIALKLVLHACGHTLSDVRVMSPSGHVAFGTAFYGAMAIMLTTGRERRVQVLVGTATALLLIGVGISRVRTGAHTVPEVLIAVGVGAASVALFATLHAWARRPTLPWIPIAAGFAVALAMLGGSHFSLERSIAGHARRMAASLDVCAPVPGRNPWRFSSGRH